MPTFQGKTSKTFQLRASCQGSSNNNHEDSIYDKVRVREIWVAELQIYVFETIELRNYALQILQHLGLHPEPPPTTPSEVVTTPISHWRENSIDVRVRAIENFLAEHVNFGLEMKSYVSQIMQHSDLHTQLLAPTPSIVATTSVIHQLQNSTNVVGALDNAIAILRDYLQKAMNPSYGID
ncbi:uncharacterized protein G2W53_003313 [Senna tora]|uniref:Uncharacterized protein n=1 Tax=Senna tora TaxID=362788 RepID=A0A834XA05_9FABA|nr:uncharacterized protein G2W53_003313 [Senna tora]